jgi:hypothetical protein
MRMHLPWYFWSRPADSDDATEEWRDGEWRKREGRVPFEEEMVAEAVAAGGDSVSPTITCCPAAAAESSTALVSAGSMGADGKSLAADTVVNDSFHTLRPWYCVEAFHVAVFKLEFASCFLLLAVKNYTALR